MITDYDSLVSAISSWSHRDDLSTQYATFIALAENEIYNNQIEPLKLRSMETIQTALSSTGRYMALPSGYESIRSITFITDSSNNEIQYQSPQVMQRRSYTGKPQFFTIVGDEIEFDRLPDQNYEVEIKIFTRPTNIDETTNTTNTVLTNHPSIYLYGALAQLFFNAQDEEQAVKYDRLFVNAIRGANKANKKGRYGPAPTMQTITSAP
jgi:hypothetical protein